jgi:putative acetyltransferase
MVLFGLGSLNHSSKITRRHALNWREMSASVTLRPATTAEDLEVVRILLREYAAYLNRSLGEEHICLESYEKELASLPGPYAEPEGTILLAFVNNEPAGCAALKPLKPDRTVDRGTASEMKRLWVRPEFRGQSIGLVLAGELIQCARRQGYTAMYLDTVPAAMQAANIIYKKLGFQPVERYNTNPILGANPAVAVEFYRLRLTPDR